MKHYTILWLCGFIIFHAAFSHAQTVKRNRDEGTMHIGASNVLGNGNISAYLTGNAIYNGEFMLSPCLGGMVGITDIMELSGQLVPITKRGLGPIEAHLQITPPGNDKLRFFGIAVFADLFLSTMQDTFSSTSAKEKPEYNSYPSASLVVDLDWLALKKWLPLKTYIKCSITENPELLYRYDQLMFTSAIEWKMYEHSLFAGAGLGMYKEKPTKTRPGDVSFSQKYAWVEPGGRYRLFNLFSVLGSVKFTLYQDLKEKNPLKPELFNASLKIEVPLFFRETNTEAIRSLIFLEKNQDKKAQTVKDDVSFGKKLLRSISSQTEGDDTLSSFDFSQERQELTQRREEAQSKMAEIEKLFTDIDREDSLKTSYKINTALPPKILQDTIKTKQRR